MATFIEPNKTKAIFFRNWLNLFFALSLFMMLILSCGKSENGQSQADGKTSLRGNIAISGAFALYPMTVKWAEEFNKSYPEVRIDISAGGAGKGMADALSGTVDLGMFSREIMSAEKERGVWWVAVCIDAVLPTISAANPCLNQLKSRGLTRAEFIRIFIDRKINNWSQLLGPQCDKDIHVFTRSDACGAAGTWARYLGGVQEDLQGIGVFGDPGLADVVKKDALGIGYNNTIYIYDINSGQKYEGLEVLPIDINENGRIDDDENIYNTMDDIMQAISTGKYPSPPARQLYFVAKGKPENPAVTALLRWILNAGQKFVKTGGYVPMDQKLIRDELSKLD